MTQRPALFDFDNTLADPAGGGAIKWPLNTLSTSDDAPSPLEHRYR
ncbi:hypothetical protein [Glycomyces halotolerans]